MNRRKLVWISTVAAFISLTPLAIGQNPLPVINQPLAPDTIKPGAAGFSLTVNGTGFVSGAVVHWNGTALITKFVTHSQLMATVPVTDVAKASTAAVTVVNPGPGGGTSNVVFFPVTTSSSSIALTSPAEFSTGSQPASVAVADFNGDGKLDLAVPNIGSNDISVLLGNGDGTFRPAVNYSVGTGPYSVAVGDFNADGNLDLAVSNNNGPGNVSILLGNGDGTFQAAVDYAVGSQPNSVVTADLNGDGKLDLLTSNAGSNNVTVLLGNGDGTFKPAVDYASGGSAVGPAAVGDFNGDGKLDFAVANQHAGGPVSVFLGNGDGTFQAAVNYTVGSSPHGVAVADFNGDGKLDLAVANNISGDVSVLLGNGDGTFKAAVNYAVGSGPNSVVVEDLNGDGKLDLVIADAFTNTITVLLGNGDGTFQAAVTFPAGAQSNSAVLGDFNGDGRLDFASADLNSGKISVVLQGTTVTLLPPTLAFGSHVVGSTTTAQSVTLTNTGPLVLSVSGIAISGTDAVDFSQTNNCGTRLAIGAACTINVTFKPLKTGPAAAAVTMTGTAAGSPLSVGLSGTGVVSGPNATLAPTSLTFLTQLVSTSSTAQSIKLTDYGTVALSISSIGFMGANPGDFQRTSSCGTSVAPGGNCTISVTFKPTQTGPRAASLSITDDAPGSPQKVTVNGTGTVVGLNPTSLSFGTHLLGTTSTLSTTLTNTGSTTLTISGIRILGTDAADFTQSNTCGGNVAGGAACTVNVTFKPTATGLRTANLSISDNGGGSPQAVSLSGSGAQIYVCACGGRCSFYCHLYCKKGCVPLSSTTRVEENASRLSCDVSGMDWLTGLR